MDRNHGFFILLPIFNSNQRNTIQMISKFLFTLAMAMVPVIELRGAIPLGLATDLPVWLTFVAAVVGNMLPVPIIILFVRKVFAWMRRQSAWLEDKVSRLEHRAEKKAQLIFKYELLGLLILVAIPLPGTGAWTGALVASLLNIRMKVAFPVILGGVVIAGIIVTCISCGIFAIV